MEIDKNEVNDAQDCSQSRDYKGIWDFPFMKLGKNEPDPEIDLNSRVPSEVFESVSRKLAETLPVFALGHPNSAVRDLSRLLFEKLMVVRYEKTEEPS